MQLQERQPRSPHDCSASARYGGIPQRVPLVGQMLSDPCTRLVERSVDARWWYECGLRPLNVGFNPHRSELYYATTSEVADWLRNPETDLRDLNQGDHLLRELMFLVHDYLHDWAGRLINELWPEVGFGRGRIDVATTDDLAFCQLLAEAAATVGLDYWCLACIDIERDLNIGSDFSTLTTTYHERHRSEYERVGATIPVQEPSFFAALCRFYCTGRFPGVDREVIRRSPRAKAWLAHELRYGRLQRVYTREWIEFLVGERIFGSGERGRELPEWSARQQALVDEVGKTLWDMVKEGRVYLPSRVGEPDGSWSSSALNPIDFRFVNANAVGADLRRVVENEGYVWSSTEVLKRQIVAQIDVDDLDAGQAGAIVSAAAGLSPTDLLALTARFRRFEPQKEEPYDLFLLS